MLIINANHGVSAVSHEGGQIETLKVDSGVFEVPDDLARRLLSFGQLWSPWYGDPKSLAEEEPAHAHEEAPAAKPVAKPVAKPAAKA